MQIPNARDFGPRGRIPNIQPHRHSRAPQNADVAANQAFDRRQIERMRRASPSDEAEWIAIRTVLINAKKHENLRNRVRDFYLERAARHLVQALIEAAGGNVSRV